MALCPNAAALQVSGFLPRTSLLRVSLVEGTRAWVGVYAPVDVDLETKPLARAVKVGQAGVETAKLALQAWQIGLLNNKFALKSVGLQPKGGSNAAPLPRDLKNPTACLVSYKDPETQALIKPPLHVF